MENQCVKIGVLEQGIGVSEAFPLRHGSSGA